MSQESKTKKLGKLTVREFFARFPDEQTCLDHIMEVRFGMRHICRKCKAEGTFHKLANRRAYSCAHCGDHVYPTAKTIFEDTRTPLQVWFYAIYLFVATRHGVSGKELERTLGVTYKTAWRISHEIRTLMIKADNFDVLRGHVELDEAYMGGRKQGKGFGRGVGGKTVVFGMAERGGQKHARVVPDASRETLRPIVINTIERGSIVSTDEWQSYGLLTPDDYKHGRVKHSNKEYVRIVDGVKHHTNTVESFWNLFKNSIRSTHIHVSAKYMDRYLGEFTFRSNRRAMENAMFDLLISAI